MGCIFSKKSFIANNEIAGQEEMCWAIFDQLNFSKSDIDALFHAFCEIDVHHCGSIRPIELFTYFNIEVGQFEEAMFAVFDEDKSGKLTFLEFVCSMWNLLSLPANIMGSLCYLMKDPTGALRVHYSDMREVMELMHRKKVDATSSLSIIMQELKNKYNAELSVQDVCKWANSNSSILSPIVIMQLKFRKQLLGEKYWNHATDERAANKERSTVEWMRKFFDMVRKKSSDARRIRKEAASNKNNKRENMSESQKNIHDKQQLLLSSFNMIQQPSQRGNPNDTIDENAQISPSAKRKRRQSGSENTGFNSPSQQQRVVPSTSNSNNNNTPGMNRDGSVKSRKALSGLDTTADVSGDGTSQQPSPKRPPSSRKSSTKNMSSADTSSPSQPQTRGSRTSLQQESPSLGGRKGSTKSRN